MLDAVHAAPEIKTRAKAEAPWWLDSARQGLEAGLVRIVARSPASPIYRAIRADLDAVSPAERPLLLALFHHHRRHELDAQPCNGRLRRLRGPGVGELSEFAMIGGGMLWRGAPLSGPPCAIDAGRFVNIVERSEAGEAALLTFDTAWAQSEPPTLRCALTDRARAAIAWLRNRRA